MTFLLHLCPWKLKLNGAKNKSILAFSLIGTGKSHHWSMEPPKTHGRKINFKHNLLCFECFLQKVAIVAADLIVIVSCFLIVGTATEKARYLIYNLRVLEISEKSSRITKCVGYRVERVCTLTFYVLGLCYYVYCCLKALALYHAALSCLYQTSCRWIMWQSCDLSV